MVLREMTPLKEPFLNLQAAGFIGLEQEDRPMPSLRFLAGTGSQEIFDFRAEGY